MLWYGSRHYDPALGCFIQPDSIVPSSTQGVQAYDRYAYTNNNPVRYTDPSGHCISDPVSFFVCAMVAGAVIEGGINAYTQYQNTGHIDAAEVMGAAAEGALIGGGVVLAAVAVTALLPAAVAGTTAVCADGDCTNEVAAVSNVAQTLGADSDPTNEITAVTQNTSTGANQFWTQVTEFKGNTVYQRPDLVQATEPNLELMQNGRPPIGPDGLPIQLHHMLQTMDGPIAEVSTTFHQQFSRIIHINPNTIPSGINRLEFAAWRAEYWIERANNFLNK